MLTAYLTLFRRGTLRMTQPALVAFGTEGDGAHQKIYLRTLLYSTGKRGQLVENMFLKVRHGESVQNFNFWGYGERESLVPGSGLFVPQEGIALNHHFLPPEGVKFEFQAAEYVVETCASLVGKRTPLVLNRVILTLSQKEADSIKTEMSWLVFLWGPDSRKYHSNVKKRPPEPTGAW